MAGISDIIGNIKNFFQQRKETESQPTMKPEDEGKTFGNGEFYYDDPNLIRFIQQKADENGTSYQDELMKYGISDDIQKEMKTNKFEMDKPYFRNIHIFHIDVLTIDLVSHRLVPRHEVIRDKGQIKHIFEDTKTNEYLLPVILRTDPIAKLKRLCPGNICKITRSSETCGENVYYRICK